MAFRPGRCKGCLSAPGEIKTKPQLRRLSPSIQTNRIQFVASSMLKKRCELCRSMRPRDLGPRHLLNSLRAFVRSVDKLEPRVNCQPSVMYWCEPRRAQMQCPCRSRIIFSMAWRYEAKTCDS